MANEHPEYLAFVRSLRCRMWMNDPCNGPVHAHHAGERGLGQRAHDDTAIPLCAKHHRAWHDCQPPFRGMSKPERRGWAKRQIKWTRKRFESANSGDERIAF